MRKSLGVFVLSTTLLLFGFQPAFGNGDDDVFGVESIRPFLRTQLPSPLWVEPEDGYLHYGTAFNGGQNASLNQISYIESMFFDENNDWVLNRVCDDYFDNTCFTENSYSSSTNASVILPVCSDDARFACLESMAITKNGVTTEGTFLEYVDNSISEPRKAEILSQQRSWFTSGVTVDFPLSPEWEADPERGLPAAKSPSKWEVENVQNKGMTDTYMARATLRININSTNDEVFFDSLSAEVIPYVEATSGTFYPPTFFNRYNTGDNYSDGSFPGSPNYPMASFDNPGNIDPITCAWEEESSVDPISPSRCGIAVQFADGSRTSMTVRIPQQLGGWFHGRVAQADLDLSVINPDLNRLVISAEDVDVPTAGASFPILDPAFAAYKNHFYANNASGLNYIIDREGDNPIADDPARGLGSFDQWQAEWSVEPFTVMEPLMGDTSDGSVNMWQFETLPSDETSNECFANRNRIQGMISTNAMVYQAGLPSFGLEGFTYQVGGLHKDYLGEITRGSYSLIMRTEEARCLYKLGDSAFRSEVAVTDLLGANKSSLTSVTNDGTWIRIWADEFTFSSPRISLNLTKASSAVPPALSAPASTPTIKISAKKQLKVKSALSAQSLRFLSKVKAKPGDKIYISLQSGKKQNVNLKKSYIYFKNPGTYVVRVTVDRKIGPNVTKYLRVTVKK